jgi:hypothetical protein
MTPRQLAWTAAALVHLTLVALSAAKVQLPGQGLATVLTAQYEDVSGADTEYGFFAPAVASQCRAVLTLRDAQGREWNDTVVDESSAQFGWRTGSAIDAIPRLPERLRRALACSWAAAMFGRHSDAVEVDVDAQIEMLPTMDDWNEGARPEWTSFYKTTFVRKGAQR